ncbi:MAG: YraN family protein [Pygmaiobacter sp.]
MNAQMIGLLGETAAAKLYRSLGYSVIAANFRTRLGEIDLIVERKKHLVFAEVKTRATDCCALPREAVTVTKQRRLLAAANEYLSRLEWEPATICFDVVEVFHDGDKVIRINRIENAFEE